MVALGLILAIIGLGGGVMMAWLAMRSTAGVPLEGAGMAVSVLPITLFAAGAVSMLLLWLGWRLFVVGNRRRRARRAEIRQLRDTTAQTERERAHAEPPASRATTPAETSSSTGTAGSGTVTTSSSEPPNTRSGERPVRGPMD